MSYSRGQVPAAAPAAHPDSAPSAPPPRADASSHRTQTQRPRHRVPTPTPPRRAPASATSATRHGDARELWLGQVGAAASGAPPGSPPSATASPADASPYRTGSSASGNAFPRRHLLVLRLLQRP